VGLKKKSGDQNIGKDVAGVGTKIHVIMGRKEAICVQITGANTNDAKPAVEMLNLLNHKAIDRFIGDKAYDTNRIRQELNNMNIKAEIPNKRNRKIPFRFDKTIYKWRYKIENMFCKIKENRRLSMRFDKLDTSFMAFIALAFIKLEVC
jgi:transposase